MPPRERPATATPRRSPVLSVVGLCMVVLGGLVVQGVFVAAIVIAAFEGNLGVPILPVIIGGAVVAIIGWVLALVGALTRRGRVVGWIGVGLGVLGGIVTVVLYGGTILVVEVLHL